MEVHQLKQDQDYESVLEVMLQLRPSYNLETLSAQVQRQMSCGYQIAYVKSEDGILAVAGFCIGEKLAWSKHIYVDDLVTNQNFRSKGVGKYLLDWLKQYALESGCKQIHLDSGVQRFAAHKFYLREGFTIASHHFAMSEVKGG